MENETEYDKLFQRLQDDLSKVKDKQLRDKLDRHLGLRFPILEEFDCIGEDLRPELANLDGHVFGGAQNPNLSREDVIETIEFFDPQLGEIEANPGLSGQLLLYVQSLRDIIDHLKEKYDYKEPNQERPS